MDEKKGVNDILTNPSFPEYVKVGYADDIRSACSSFTAVSAHHALRMGPWNKIQSCLACFA